MAQKKQEWDDSVPIHSLRINPTPVEAERDSNSGVGNFFLFSVGSRFFSDVVSFDALKESKGFAFQSGPQLSKSYEVMRVTCGNGTSVLREGQKDLRPWSVGLSRTLQAFLSKCSGESQPS